MVSFLYQMKQRLEKHGAIIMWATTAIVVLLALYVWANQLSWNIGELSSYQIFPLLGLIGYSLMIMHYPSGVMKRIAPKAMDYDHYFLWTSRAVLILILLHPGLLILQRFADGFGLPPGSYLSYVDSGLKIAVMFGVISLLVFLFFELKDKLKTKRWWPVVEHINNAAMILVWVHAFQLGGHISGWYEIVWYFYGATLLISITYLYVTKKSPPLVASS